MKTRFFKVGFYLSIIHALVTIVLTLYVFRKGMVRFDNLEIPISSFETVVQFAVSILMQPVSSLWTMGLNQHFQAVEWGAFLFNSLLWGFVIGFFFEFWQSFMSSHKSVVNYKKGHTS